MSSITDTFQANVNQLTGPGAPWELGATDVNGLTLPAYSNAPTNLVNLINEGRKHGDAEFLIYEGERITFNEFFARVDTLAYALKNTLSVNPQDTVAIAMRNYPEWMISFAAISLIGAIAVPVNSWGQQQELLHSLKDSGSKVLFCDEARYKLIEDDLEGINTKAVVVRAEGDTPNATSFANLLDSSNKLDEVDYFNAETTEKALIMYTSGTTGLPKGVVSNHRNICQSIFNFEMLAIASAMTDPGPVGKMLERGHPPKVLLGVPLFHVAGCYSVFLLSLRAGRPIVMMHKWDKVKALAYIQNERITMISAVPTMLLELLECDEWDNFDTSSMFGFGAGGSAAPARLTKTLFEKLPDSFPGTGYGMTESNATGFASTGAVFAEQPTSCGLKSPLINLKIVDEAGKEVPQGEIGEIYTQSIATALGYNNNKKATAETFIDGWLRTGDVGYINEDGYLFITDRMKDMIIRGGENVYSVEVEAAALSHPEVLEAAVFGKPHDTLGEEVAIAIYRDSSSSLDVEALQTHIGTRLATFKIPAHVFISEEPLPRNATQKILKPQIKKQYIA